MANNIPVKTPATTSRRHFLQQSTAAIATLALSPAVLSAAPSETLLTTPSGKLRGETANGVRIFRGIPFAEPPTGPLRFRPPAPIKPWKNIREATAFAPAAMQQVTDLSVSPNMSEDCLYLNVWAPAGKGPYPVFVWIHGGSFTGGRSSATISDGTLFAQQDIVHVTLAYRLGVLGFMDLSPLLGTEYADSANNALRDLIAALQWINQNIAAFGGDPNRVTIGGESAGAKATAARLAEANTKAGGPTWIYRLDYTKPTGRYAGESYHSLDLSLIWEQLDTDEKADSAAAPLSLLMHQAWVAFISGNPPAAPHLRQWPQYNPDTRATMLLSVQPHIEENPFDTELELWNGVL